MEEKEDTDSHSPELRFTVRVSFVEIYMEQIHDLLAASSSAVQLQQQGDGSVKMLCTEIEASTPDEVRATLRQLTSLIKDGCPSKSRKFVRSSLSSFAFPPPLPTTNSPSPLRPWPSPSPLSSYLTCMIAFVFKSCSC